METFNKTGCQNLDLEFAGSRPGVGEAIPQHLLQPLALQICQLGLKCLVTYRNCISENLHFFNSLGQGRGKVIPYNILQLLQPPQVCF